MNLEDFSHLLAFRKPKEIEQEDEIKEIYEKKLKDIKREFESRLQAEIQKAFEKGLTEGKEKARKEFEKEIDELKEKYEKLITEKDIDIEKFISEFRTKLKNNIFTVKEVILNALNEMLEFLYISKENAKYIKDIIEEIVDEFKEESQIEIEVGENLKSFIKESDKVKVRVDTNLNPSDFRIKFSNFTVESNFKDKMRILREEIEREIKKSS
jgi:flagellar biosynthesis/type III secretory pathway protein FliH